MKKILKLSLIFSVLTLIFVGCSRDEDGTNAVLPTLTKSGMKIETLSVDKLSNTEPDSYGNVYERISIKYKVSGKRENAMYNLISYRVGCLENGKKSTNSTGSWNGLQDPNGGEYTAELIIQNNNPISKGITFDFNDVQVFVCYTKSDGTTGCESN